MAPKVSPPFFSFILLLLLPILLHAVIAADSHDHQKASSTFESLKNLHGCRKGDKVKGIQDLKKYLKYYGYLSPNTNSKNKILSDSHADDDDSDDFDDLLESAIKTYQLNYHINVTGTLDVETVSKMMMPRCGVPDIINGTNWMLYGKKREEHHDNHGPKSLRTVSHYALFPGNLKWSKKHFNYAFHPSTPTNFLYDLDLAFRVWDSVLTPYGFNFERTEDYENADMKVKFERGDHGDGHPFEGPGGQLAHASAPPGGWLHIDADERLSAGRPVKGAFDVESIAIHEIGHMLGLEHSSVEDAVMHPYLPPGKRKLVHVDDLNGIKALYGV